MHASLSMQQQTNFFVVYLTSVRCADSQLVLRLHFPHLYLCTYIYLHIHTYHMHNNYVMYVVAMQPYLSQL